MSALALRWPMLRTLRLKWLAAALLALAAAVAVGVSLLPNREADAATLNVKISPAKAALLIDATSGAQANQFAAVGNSNSLMFEVWYDLPSLRKEAIISVTTAFFDNDGVAFNKVLDLTVAP